MTAGPPPLAVTNPSAAISRLRNRLAELAELDSSMPRDPRFEALEHAIQSNVREIFGEDSPEDTNHWNLRIEHSEEPFYLPIGYGDSDDDHEGSYGYERSNAKRIKERREGIARTKVILESLVKRLEERVGENVQTQQGVGDMASPWNALAGDRITLVKADGKEAATHVRAVVNPDNMLISRATFPVESGDTIVREMVPGVPPERYEVLDAHFVKLPGGGASHWQLKVRRRGARSEPTQRSPAPTHVVHNTHNYNITGPAAAVGPGATATDNAIVQHNNQQVWNEIDHGRIVDELSRLRAALSGTAGGQSDEAEEAAVDLGHVGQATKALKTGDQNGFVAALKKLGSKAWTLAEALGLSYFDHVAREKLGLPPPGGAGV